MKTILTTIAIAIIALSSCATHKQTSEEVSWQAFCEEYGYSLNDNSSEVINKYLDTWRGSVTEEAALTAAGVELF